MAVASQIGAVCSFDFQQPSGYWVRKMTCLGYTYTYIYVILHRYIVLHARRRHLLLKMGRETGGIVLRKFKLGVESYDTYYFAKHNEKIIPLKHFIAYFLNVHLISYKFFL